MKKFTIVRVSMMFLLIVLGLPMLFLPADGVSLIETSITLEQLQNFEEQLSNSAEEVGISLDGYDPYVPLLLVETDSITGIGISPAISSQEIGSISYITTGYEGKFDDYYSTYGLTHDGIDDYFSDSIMVDDYEIQSFGIEHDIPMSNGEYDLAFCTVDTYEKYNFDGMVVYVKSEYIETEHVLSVYYAGQVGKSDICQFACYVKGETEMTELLARRMDKDFKCIPLSELLSEPPPTTTTVTTTQPTTTTSTTNNASLVVMRIDDLYAAVNGTRVKIHDTKDLAPVYSSTGKAMVPFRFISTAFGAEVDWDDSTGSVIIDYNDIHLVMPIGQTTVFVNGNPVVIPTPAQIIDGNTFVPIKVVTDQLELTTEWDGDTVSIVTSDEEIDLEAAIAQAEAILGRSPHVLAELSMLADNQKSKILLLGSQKDGCSVVSGKTLVTVDKLVYMKSGASVNISGNTATISYNSKTLTATAGDDFITIDSVQQNNQPVRIISGQFFVPLEAVADFLDLDVDYDNISKYIVSDQNVVTFDAYQIGDYEIAALRYLAKIMITQ